MEIKNVIKNVNGGTTIVLSIPEKHMVRLMRALHFGYFDQSNVIGIRESTPVAFEDTKEKLLELIKANEEQPAAKPSGGE